MNQPKHQLSLWLHKRHVADIGYDPLNEAWSLRYTDEWSQDRQAFALSPALPLHAECSSASIRRFIENLLPEGRALDIVASAQGVAKSNVYGLIRALGAETTGAFRFLPYGEDGSTEPARILPREISLAELDERIGERETRPLVEWHGKVQMSVAGHQDKLLVYASGEPGETPMFLPDFPLASTHILKPEPADARLPHMVANEHFCMTLARRIGLPAASVSIFRTPRPVLAIERFDRVAHNDTSGAWVERKHIIDACQSSDLSAAYKYERNIGSVGEAALYRDGVSLPRLFGLLEHATRKAVDRLAMLRWALFQLVIGNSDAHGKNFSFFVHRSGLQAAPWYDLVSVVQYPQFSHDLAMAIGDEFNLDQIKAFSLADFAQRCGIDRQLLVRECRRMRVGVRQHAAEVANSQLYLAEERALVNKIVELALTQSEWLETMSREASSIPSDLL
ncbi:HipA domain-containing protein [Pseudoduganella sp. S-14]|jgi:serine/threonine-protein kinase HipA|uniref:HipA domain-containing protein n=1 Tax=Pseudoduganella sp. S-14 TaxID=3404065 RepID=UPI003CF81C80